MNEIQCHPRQKCLDHIVPLNRGGKHKKYNVRYICRDCNNKRPKDGSDTIKSSDKTIKSSLLYGKSKKAIIIHLKAK